MAEQAEKTHAPERRATLRCQFCSTLNRVDVRRASQRPKCGKCGRPILLDRPIKMTAEDLSNFLRDAEVPLLVDFYADWCGPCKVMAPVLDEFARDHQGELVVAKLDTDRNPAVTAQYGVRGIPTLIAFRDGREVARKTGAIARSELDKLLRSAIG